MSVLQEIEQHRPQLQELCQRLGVPGLRVRLNADNWRQVTFIGDIDISRFDGYADRYFDLEEGLVRIFHRPVYLLDEEGVRRVELRDAARVKTAPTEIELLHAS